jgi:hypothetical protein
MIPWGQRLRWAGLAMICSGLAFTVGALRAFTLADLLADSRLTPKRFADRFWDFDYQVFPYVQDPDVFLKSKTGNCQDYAIMADYVLKRKTYQTRLIHVVLACGSAHDVCYVTQVKGYLDYNNRIYSRNVQRSGRTVREIADQAAASFDQDWTTASVYTYDYSEDFKHLTLTVVKTDPPSEDADAGPQLASQ